MIRVGHAIVCLIVLTVVGSASAQQAGVTRTVLRSIEFPAGYTTVIAIVQLAPGTCAGRHTHPGIDSGFVIQGDLVLKADGKPEQTLKAGDSYETQPLVPHDACTVSGNKPIDTFGGREMQAAGVPSALIGAVRTGISRTAVHPPPDLVVGHISTERGLPSVDNRVV